MGRVLGESGLVGLYTLWLVFEFPCSYSNKQKSAEREVQERSLTWCDVVFCFPVRMGIFRKIAGFLGLSKDEVHEEEEGEGQPRTTPYRVKETGLPRKGFSVPAQVVLDRPHLAPILTPSTSGDGGVQGLRWYAKRLRIDEDGDVADEFIDEVSSEAPTLSVDPHKTETRFKHKGATRPAKVKQQVLSDGKLMHFVEHRGRLQLV